MPEGAGGAGVEVGVMVGVAADWPPSVGLGRGVAYVMETPPVLVTSIFSTTEVIAGKLVALILRSPAWGILNGPLATP